MRLRKRTRTQVARAGPSSSGPLTGTNPAVPPPSATARPVGAGRLGTQTAPTVRTLDDGLGLPPVPPELQSYYSLGRGGDGFMPVEAAAQRQGVEVEELMRLVNQGILSSRYEGIASRRSACGGVSPVRLLRCGTCGRTLHSLTEVASCGLRRRPPEPTHEAASRVTSEHCSRLRFGEWAESGRSRLHP